jgi:hypothetical protein
MPGSIYSISLNIFSTLASSGNAKKLTRSTPSSSISTSHASGI